MSLPAQVLQLLILMLQLQPPPSLMPNTLGSGETDTLSLLLQEYFFLMRHGLTSYKGISSDRSDTMTTSGNLDDGATPTTPLHQINRDDAAHSYDRRTAARRPILLRPDHQVRMDDLERQVSVSRGDPCGG